jgi:hypothetical protein
MVCLLRIVCIPLIGVLLDCLLVLQAKLARFNAMFAQDYTVRKKMLLQRLHVTADSLMYSKKIADQLAEIRPLVQAKLAVLPANSYMDASAVFTATPALLMSGKVTDHLSATPVRKILIGMRQRLRFGEQRVEVLPSSAISQHSSKNVRCHWGELVR